MEIDSDPEFANELGKLAKLLEASAGVARRLVARRVRNRAEMHDLADQLEDVATAFHEIAEADLGKQAKGKHTS